MLGHTSVTSSQGKDLRRCDANKKLKSWKKIVHRLSLGSWEQENYKCYINIYPASIYETLRIWSAKSQGHDNQTKSQPSGAVQSM